MYFWRIEKLKTSMATAPLTDREVLPYLIATVILMAAVLGGAQHVPVTSVWDDISSIFGMVIAVIGTIYIYNRNNGEAGQHFLQRYIVIGWVVSLRWLVAFMVIFTILYIILEYYGASAENIALAEFTFDTLASAVLYWRIGHHVHDLAQRTLTR